MTCSASHIGRLRLDVSAICSIAKSIQRTKSNALLAIRYTSGLTSDCTTFKAIMFSQYDHDHHVVFIAIDPDL